MPPHSLAALAHVLALFLAALAVGAWLAAFGVLERLPAALGDSLFRASSGGPR